MTSGGLFFRQLLKGFLGCERNPFCQADVRKHRNAGAEAAQSMIKATGGHAIGGATRHGVFCRIRIFVSKKKMRW